MPLNAMSIEQVERPSDSPDHEVTLDEIIAEQRRLQLKVREQNRILRERQDQLMSTVEQLQEREADAVKLAVIAQEESRKVAQALDDLKQAQEKLLRSEKLAAVGQLAASVGHDLRNPLAAIRSAWYFIEKKLLLSEASREPRLAKFSAIIDSELERCSKIIGDLLDFSRERPLHRVPYPLARLVADAFAVVVKPSPKIELIAEIAPDTPTPFIDADQLRQVVVNLVQNAVEAVEPVSGRVRVLGGRAGNGIVLKVIDNGSGIPEDVKKNIFEPLYTTKLRGTGLGLAICVSIVARHGGTIQVESEAGKGSAFIVQLPRGSPSYSAAPAVGGTADLRNHEHTEDDPHR